MGYITRKFYGENAAKESVVVNSTAEKTEKNDTKKQINVEKKKVRTSTNKVSSSEGKRKAPNLKATNQDFLYQHQELPQKRFFLE